MVRIELTATNLSDWLPQPGGLIAIRPVVSAGGATRAGTPGGVPEKFQSITTYAVGQLVFLLTMVVLST